MVEDLLPPPCKHTDHFVRIAPIDQPAKDSPESPQSNRRPIETMHISILQRDQRALLASELGEHPSVDLLGVCEGLQLPLSEHSEAPESNQCPRSLRHPNSPIARIYCGALLAPVWYAIPGMKQIRRRSPYRSQEQGQPSRSFIEIHRCLAFPNRTGGCHRSSPFLALHRPGEPPVPASRWWNHGSLRRFPKLFGPCFGQ